MAATDQLAARVHARLARIDAAGLRRALHPPTGIDLSSNDYLGLSAHPLLKTRMSDAVLREGCGSTASRLLRGDRESCTAVEERFAAFKRTERALYFGSGYAANLSVLSSLLEEGDVVFSDERNHASLIDGMRLSRATRVIFPHNDTAALKRLLNSQAARLPGSQAFVVTESVFSMDGDLAPLADYAGICRAANAILIVDEAHAIGVFGERGSGAIEAARVDDEVCVSVNAGGKAMGVAGAFVAGPAWAIEYLIQRARPFIFSTAPPPALAAALDASLTIIADEPARRSRLFSLASFLRASLHDAGVDVPAGTSQIIPILVGENDRAMAVAAMMQAEGFDVRAIRPPTVPARTARLRISVNVNLTEEILTRFVAALARALSHTSSCVTASS